jgi:hypothetical protein
MSLRLEDVLVSEVAEAGRARRLVPSHPSPSQYEQTTTPRSTACWGSVVGVERLVTVAFGPSPSKRFGRALAEARSRAGECNEVEPGRYQARFVLGEDSAAYSGLARVLERVRHWRATEVYEDDEQVSADHAREMAWCASAQLKAFGNCRFRFDWGVVPRCSLCPLFDAERAIRDVLGENGPRGMVFEIRFGPRVQALLRGESPSMSEKELDLDWHVPDFAPEEWRNSSGEEEAG